MADCNEALEELQRFLDEEITEATRSAVLAHLETCLDCHQAFDFHAELRMVVAMACRDDEVPAGLLSRLEQCVQFDLDGDGAIG
jgi:mycothiol system anti-sigma-R factor